MRKLLTIALLSMATWAQTPPWSQTRADIDRALQAQPANLEQLQSLGETALSQGHYAEVVLISEAILKAHPDHFVGLLQGVEAQLALQHPERARPLLERMRQVAPEHPETFAMGGLVDVFQGQAGPAVDQFRQALARGRASEVHPKRLASYANSLLVALHKSGQMPQALKECEPFLEEFPDCPDLWISACRLYRESAQLEKSLATAREGLQRFPEVANFWASVALAEARLGHSQQSESAYAELLRRDPSLARALRPILDGTRPDQSQIELNVK